MPERARTPQETIAELRALADAIEANLPPGGNGEGDDGDGTVTRAHTARERAQRLGLRIIQGGAVGIAAAAIGRWARDNTAATALIVAGAAAAGGMTLAPAIAPVVPGLPVIGAGDHPVPAVTHTIAVPAPAPIETVTVSPSPSPAPTATPSPTPSPSASPSPSAPPATDTPAPAAEPTGGDGGGGDAPPAEPDGRNAPPAAEPAPGAERPGPPDDPPPARAPRPQTVPCVLGASVPPLLGLCVLSGEA